MVPTKTSQWHEQLQDIKKNSKQKKREKHSTTTEPCLETSAVIAATPTLLLPDEGPATVEKEDSLPLLPVRWGKKRHPKSPSTSSIPPRLAHMVLITAMTTIAEMRSWREVGTSRFLVRVACACARCVVCVSSVHYACMTCVYACARCVCVCFVFRMNHSTYLVYVVNSMTVSTFPNMKSRGYRSNPRA